MSPEFTKLEAETHEEIDEKLIAAGWVIWDKKQLNLYDFLSVAVCEIDMDTGPADNKRKGKNLDGVTEQSQRYATLILRHIQRAAANDEPLSFTACTEVYHLAKFAKAKRVLFLVGRDSLGRQALKEFKQCTVPVDGVNSRNSIMPIY